MAPSIQKKTKIILDADVIIHFDKGGCFSTLLDIFPEFEYIVLDVVYHELNKTRKALIDNTAILLKKVSKVTFSPLGDSRKDYAILKSTKGAGESACMIYCKDNHDVLGSSNLRDVSDYCLTHEITLLTTLDFLYYAFTRGKMTQQECVEFIQKVKSKGSVLPNEITDIAAYTCNVVI